MIPNTKANPLAIVVPQLPTLPLHIGLAKSTIADITVLAITHNNKFVVIWYIINIKG